MLAVYPARPAPLRRSRLPGQGVPAPTLAPAPQSTVSTTVPLTAPTPSETQTIPFAMAGEYVGWEMAVEGRVLDVYRSERVARLSFHQDWRRHFNVVIFPDSWPLFAARPEYMFPGRTVRVRGVRSVHQGAPQTMVRWADQIVVVEEE